MPVAKAVKAVCPTFPENCKKPKALPRPWASLLSATKLNSSGCTMPKPTPFRALKKTIQERLGEKVTPTSAAAQTTAPSHTSSGLGSLSARKPEGRAKTDSKMPRTRPREAKSPGEALKCLAISV